MAARRELLEANATLGMPFVARVLLGLYTDAGVVCQRQAVNRVIVRPLAKVDRLIDDYLVEVFGESFHEVDMSSLGWMLQRLHDPHVLLPLASYPKRKCSERHTRSVKLRLNPAEKSVFTYFLLDEV